MNPFMNVIRGLCDLNNFSRSFKLGMYALVSKGIYKRIAAPLPSSYSTIIPLL